MRAGGGLEIPWRSRRCERHSGVSGEREKGPEYVAEQQTMPSGGWRSSTERDRQYLPGGRRRPAAHDDGCPRAFLQGSAIFEWARGKHVGLRTDADSWTRAGGEKFCACARNLAPREDGRAGLRLEAAPGGHRKHPPCFMRSPLCHNRGARYISPHPGPKEGHQGACGIKPIRPRRSPATTRRALAALLSNKASARPKPSIRAAIQAAGNLHAGRLGSIISPAVDHGANATTAICRSRFRAAHGRAAILRHRESPGEAPADYDHAKDQPMSPLHEARASARRALNLDGGAEICFRARRSTSPRRSTTGHRAGEGRRGSAQCSSSTPARSVHGVGRRGGASSATGTADQSAFVSAA